VIVSNAEGGEGSVVRVGVSQGVCLSPMGTCAVSRADGQLIRDHGLVRHHPTPKPTPSPQPLLCFVCIHKGGMPLVCES
jgi:hypothetical protein